MSRPLVRVRVHLPGREEAVALGVSLAGHVLLLAALVTFTAGRAPAGPARKVLSVRLAGAPRPAAPARPAATRRRKAASPAPRAPARRSRKPRRRTRAGAPRRVETRPESGPAARPRHLPREEAAPPSPAPPTGTETGEAKAKAKPRAAPGEGPIAGGVAGLETDEPLAADWYVGLVVARLREAWRDRPVLPRGSPPRRVVVGFTIHRDGRVDAVRVEIPSGYTPLDTSALRAVASLGRLPPLPRSYGKERLGARFVFELLPPEP